MANCRTGDGSFLRRPGGLLGKNEPSDESNKSQPYRRR